VSDIRFSSATGGEVVLFRFGSKENEEDD